MRRPHKLAAAKLGCSVRRLGQLSARYRWKTRAAAFDNHRANAASEALDRPLNEEQLDWKQRAQRFRLQEWLLHEQMFHAADHAIREFEKHPWRASLNDLLKLYELASVLGRRASGMPLDPGDAPPPEPPSPHSDSDFEEHLRRVYGGKQAADPTGKVAPCQEPSPPPPPPPSKSAGSP